MKKKNDNLRGLKISHAIIDEFDGEVMMWVNDNEKNKIIKEFEKILHKKQGKQHDRRTTRKADK